MKLMSKGLICGLAAAAVSAAGCSGNVSKTTGSNGKGPTTGEIGLNLTFSSTESIPALAYTLSNGTAADTVVGSIPIPGTFAGAPFVVPTFEILPVAAGTGYSILLTGQSADGTVTCTGSDPSTLPVSATNPGFAVTAGNETIVNVLVTCVSTSATGSVEVNTTIQSCPTISSLTAINATANTTAPGNTATIFAAAAAPNPATLTYSFALASGNTGTLSGQTTAAGNGSSSILFTCPAVAEKDTITVTTVDQTGASCGALGVASVTVTCGVPLVACQNPTVGTGTEVTGDSATGTCPAGQTNTGTLKDANGNFCCSPLACFGVGNGVEVTGDTATGACTSGVNSGTLKDGAGNFCCSALVPCTTVGQTGCVQCTGSAASPLCTPTEAALVAFDIKQGNDKTAGAPKTGSCYQCLNATGCLDDNENDTGNECEDNSGTSAFASSTTVAECEATLNCLLNTQCVAAGETSCYCGGAPPTGACVASTTAVASPTDPAVGSANNLSATLIGGACENEESVGLALATSTGQAQSNGLAVLKAFGNTTLASGRVNAIFSCGAACTACQ
jgi:hypothetical protein